MEVTLSAEGRLNQAGYHYLSVIIAFKFNIAGGIEQNTVIDHLVMKM